VGRSCSGLMLIGMGTCIAGGIREAPKTI
jgi:hypothetical protein